MSTTDAPLSVEASPEDAGSIVSTVETSTRSPAELANDAALKEITEAADLGNAAADPAPRVSSSAPANPGNIPLTEEQQARENSLRQKRNQERAQIQARLGRQSFARLTPGAATVKKVVTLNDVTVSSAMERFVPVVDQALYVVGRQGPAFIGSDDTVLVMGQITLAVDKMHTEATDELARSEVLLNQERQNDISGEWLEPSCVAPALDLEVHAKHPSTIKMIAALQRFDKLIANLTILSWNGLVPESRVQELKVRLKKLSQGVYTISNRALQGLRRKADLLSAAS